MTETVKKCPFCKNGDIYFGANCVTCRSCEADISHRDWKVIDEQRVSIAQLEADKRELMEAIEAQVGSRPEQTISMLWVAFNKHSTPSEATKETVNNNEDR